MASKGVGRRRELPLLGCVFLFWFSMYTYPSFFSSYVSERLRSPEVMTGLILGAYGFTQMLLRIPLGLASDWLGRRKRFVMLGLGCSVGASMLLCAVDMLAGKSVVPEAAHLLALTARGLSGVTASAWVNLSVLYAADYEADELAPAMSRLMVPQYGSQILAMLLGAQMAQDLGEMSAFVLAGCAALAGMLLLWRVREPAQAASERVTLRELASVLRDRGLQIGTFLDTLFHLVCWSTVLGFMSNWARDVAGMTVAQLGYLSVMYLLPNTVFGRLSGAVFAPRLGMRWVLSAGFALVGAACFLYPQARTPGLLLLTQGVFGVGMGLILPLTQATAIRDIPRQMRGAAMGVYQAVYGAGMFIGPVLAGWIIASQPTQTQGMVLNFQINGGLALVGALLTPYLLGRK